MSFFMHEQRYRSLAPAADQLITICGAGALGANLAETLARMGLRRLRAIDRDRVAAHNLSTQPWTQQDVGAAKARVLAAALSRAVAARLDAQQIELAPHNARRLLQGSAVVVDAFDNIPARAAVAEAAAALSIPCLHVALGLGGDYACGLWGDSYQLPPEPPTMLADPCDYPLTRPLALLAAASAAEVLVTFLLSGERRGFEVTLRDLHMRSA
jgi:molybdopterin-synthase adenylyltransferase